MHPSNILNILSSLEVLKLDKSNEDKDEQFENKQRILVTSEVSKFDIFSEVNETQSENIL